MSAAIVWLRRDLRLRDHPALSRAVAAHATVIPVYIHAPQEEAPWAPGGAARWWLHHSLAALADGLRQRGSRLLIRQGDSVTVLRELAQATGAAAVYWSRLYEPRTIVRDHAVEAALRADGLTVESYNAALLYEPWTVVKNDGGPFQIFTPFWKACLRLPPPAPPLPAPTTINAPALWPDSLPLAALNLAPSMAWRAGLAAAWRPGEDAALDRLAHFCEELLEHYADARDPPGVDGVSRLSPYLHFGELSPRQIWTAVNDRMQGAALERRGAAAYLRQLGWREFGHYALYHWPHTPEQPLQARFAAYPWRRDYDALLDAWRRGRTGVPLVDAGMRELWRTGWMHNRARMITASFLTKNCRIPWQEGARWFWDTLVDADLANNTLGWQWTAGCGLDAAPYFRVFNPTRQAERFDPTGAYIRRWLPELADLPTPALFRPWLPSAASKSSNYPSPVVDLETSRDEALQAYEQIKIGQ